jgi:glycosyltransferase involved in cell wall biosynthesis
MKIFDSGKNVRWEGKGFNVNGTTLSILKSSRVYHSLTLRRGSYNLKIVGKKRTGNGKFKIEVISSRGQTFFNKEMSFTNNSWTEHSFDFNIPSNGSAVTLQISRDRNAYGSIDIGKIALSVEESKANLAAQKLRSRASRRNSSSPQKLPLVNDSKYFVEFNDKRSIAFIVPYGIYGGGEIYIQNIINKLPQDLYSVYIYYMNSNNLRNYITFSGAHRRNIKKGDQLIALLKENNHNFIVYYNRLDIYNLLTGLRSSDLIRSKLIEIYHSDFKWQGAISPLKSRNYIDKIIRVAPSLTEDISGLEGYRSTLRVGIDLEKFSIKDSAFFRKKLGINPLGRPIVGTVARLSKEKNIDYVIDLANMSKDLYYIIVGDGSDRQRLQNKIDKLGLSNIKLLGFKNNIEDYYHIFDAFLLPSKIEGTPISIIEAMASGVPVFSANVGAISDIITPGENGYFISRDLREDYFLIKKNLYNVNTINNARKYVEKNHDINKIADNFINIINSTDKFFLENENKTIKMLDGIYV